MCSYHLIPSTQLSPSDSNLEQAPLLERTEISVVEEGVTLLQLNVEGLTKAKINVIEHLAQKYNPTAILLQETHASDTSRLKICGYQLAAHTKSNIYGTASFVKNGSTWKIAATCPDDSILNWTAVEVEGTTVINVYKPPVSALNKSDIPIFPAPCICAGDFNCHSTAWGYKETSLNGSALEDWASIADVTLLHDPHQPDSFRSGRWNTTSNPDLAFANVTSTLPQRLALDSFPKSQHRPSFITPHNPVEPIPTKDVKSRNFRKAKWEQFAHLVKSGIDTLPSPCTLDPNIAYTAFCQLLSQSAKKTIPRGCRQQYIPTWDDECNHYYKEFIQAEDKQSADAKAADLMDYLNKNRNKRWEETVKGIDFTLSSRKAWKTFNRLTGRKSDPKQCPITANSIAKQLLANGRFRGADKQHDLSVKRQCSMMWGGCLGSVAI